MEFLRQFESDIQNLCAALQIKKLHAFGSVTTNRFGPESDVDFLVDLGELEPGQYADRYFELAEKLEGMLGRKVDLVTERSLENPYFIQSIEQTKQLLYAA